MASEEHEDTVVSFAVGPALGTWLDEQADCTGETREEFCRRLLRTVHTTTEGESVESLERDEIDELTTRIDEQREEFVDLVADVRERVVQVKREADAKSPRDHDHQTYATTTDVDDLRSRLEDVEADLERLEATTTAGFDNFEDVLEYLLAARDDLDERTTTLATAVVDRRERIDGLAARERRRVETERLQLAANQLGIRRAVCEACDSSVTLSLLTLPECPHCGRSFADVSKRSSVFGSHTLEVGDPPALEGRVGGGNGDEYDLEHDRDREDAYDREAGADVFDDVAEYAGRGDGLDSESGESHETRDRDPDRTDETCGGTDA